MEFNETKELIEDIAEGKMVILLDDEDRENEGDLVCAAELIDDKKINFMISKARGLVCLPLSPEKCDKLNLPMMTNNNRAKHGTGFTVSIEAKEGITTGISAVDRALTIQAAANKDAIASDIVQPGHIFPLRASEGGVLSRAGHTEAACDLSRLAGLEEAGVICEIMNEDGTMARREDLEIFAKKHDLKIGTIADLIEYRSKKEKLIKKISEEELSTEFGMMKLIVYSDLLSKNTHLAFVKGTIKKNDEVIVRVHEPLSILDFVSKETPHSWPPLKALKKISDEKNGVVIFLNYNESQNNITSKLNHENITLKKSTDLRSYGIGSQILVDIGVSKMKLLAAPRKMPSMAGYGLSLIHI